jgi:hypothetical protein
MLRIFLLAAVASAMVFISPAAGVCSEDPCASSPCKNGGQCVKEVFEGNRFKCVCDKTPYVGFYCEVPRDCAKIDPCDPNPCRNGGECSATGNEGTGYDRFTCKCPDKFEGHQCEVEATEATTKAPIPTPAPTTAEPTTEPPVPKTTTVDPDPCDPFPCINKERCDPKPSNGKPYTCYCPPRYTGCKCDTEKPSECPSGFVYLSEARSCFKILTTLGDWNTQAANCKAALPVKGVDLAVITTADANADIAARIKTSIMQDPANAEGAKNCSGGLWIGAQRLNPSSCSSNFMWKTIGSCTGGTPLSYENWQTPDPNCSSSSVESCISMTPNSGYKWIDQKCDAKQCAICELVLASTA